ncbi:peptide-methionine (S)-S-oxide reductase MsrA [Cerasicoccus frondis]|uniref:peptide-methionine (S)-S-oxide reductase MsrA n=1 Tax=Cerasicoccus frondis TaxID=490090 RepID=UPI002852AC01|nr:peptide-methionine (S)-S-oxide reductase MsrA [Cerasicoccus frondis]
MKLKSTRFRKSLTAIAVVAILSFLLGCSEGTAEPKPIADMPTPNPENLEVATFGAGCFWCTEAVMQRLPGVASVESGYMGGAVDNPTYQEVCTGRTGHAEVIQVKFDPDIIRYDQLLDVFWRMHDPTTLNRQGADVGTQYRSAIFTHSNEQAETAAKSKADAQKNFKSPIVTEITPAETFFAAEDYHQDYYDNNQNAGYCRFVILPKLDKLGLDN